MDHIETEILKLHCHPGKQSNIWSLLQDLTQHGHTIRDMKDLLKLYQKSFSNETLKNIAPLPHPTVQKFTVFTVAVVGASRRFLTQITRH